MKRILTGKQSPSGGRQGRTKEKVKRKKWEGGSRGSSPLPREAGSWELEGPAVTATRPVAKSTYNAVLARSDRRERRSNPKVDSSHYPEKFQPFYPYPKGSRPEFSPGKGKNICILTRFRRKPANFLRRVVRKSESLPFLC